MKCDLTFESEIDMEDTEEVHAIQFAKVDKMCSKIFIEMQKLEA